MRYASGETGGGNKVGPFAGDVGLRYVYTEEMGWIDLGHFFQVAAVMNDRLKQSGEAVAKKIGFGSSEYYENLIKGHMKNDLRYAGGGDVINPENDEDVLTLLREGIGVGLVWNATKQVEEGQQDVGYDTQWSYEDGPSNFAGYIFFVHYYRGDETLLEDFEEFLDDMGAKKPDEAPNYEVMPKNPSSKRPYGARSRYFEQNKSLEPMHYPPLTELGLRKNPKDGKKYQEKTKPVPRYQTSKKP